MNQTYDYPLSIPRRRRLPKRTVFPIFDQFFRHCLLNILLTTLHPARNCSQISRSLISCVPLDTRHPFTRFNSRIFPTFGDLTILKVFLVAVSIKFGLLRTYDGLRDAQQCHRAVLTRNPRWTQTSRLEICCHHTYVT